MHIVFLNTHNLNFRPIFHLHQSHLERSKFYLATVQVPRNDYCNQVLTFLVMFTTYFEQISMTRIMRTAL